MLDLSNIYTVEKNGIEYAIGKLAEARDELRIMEHNAVILETACFSYIEKIENNRKSIEKSINAINLMLKILRQDY